MDYHYSFDDVVDLIGQPVGSWPQKILERYTKSKYRYDDRFAICIFNFVNGFDNKIFLQYVLAKGALRDKEAVDHIRRITHILEEWKHHFENWYSFNLVQNRWMFLNGNTKFY